MIAFKKDIELEIIESFDESTDTLVASSIEVFKAGEQVDAEIVSEDGDFIVLQFGGSGGLSLGVQRSSFEIL